MELTRKQEEGLRLAVARYKNHDPYTCIAGYAGTGKSTLVKFIIAALDLPPEKVAYIAYTGKAALVLQDKGCPNAMTAHKLLYDSYPRRDGTFYHKIKRPLDHDYRLIIVDEVSMLPAEMWDLLLSHNRHVIALGDPAQLPPIGEDNGILLEPHIFLDEIMRQAQESEIIRLTMDIREGKPLTLYKGNEVMVLPKNDFDSSMINWADQIIVGKNVTKMTLNDLARKRLHDIDDPYPIDGDKVVSLQNHWTIMTDDLSMPLVNGTTGILHKPHKQMNLPFINNRIIADIEVNNTQFKNLPLDYKLFIEGSPTVTKENFKRIPQSLRPMEFEYAYAITCHKSQGSQYNKVLVVEEYLKGGEHSRWLYTAATRAIDKLVILKDR